MTQELLATRTEGGEGSEERSLVAAESRRSSLGMTTRTEATGGRKRGRKTFEVGPSSRKALLRMTTRSEAWRGEGRRRKRREVPRRRERRASVGMTTKTEAG